MSSVALMSVLFIVLAVLMAGGFTALWLKDRERVEEEVLDEERLDTHPDRNASRESSQHR